jgi:hypothetical protein
VSRPIRPPEVQNKGLPLKESQAAGQLAQALYEFLPGSGNATWTNHVSFRSVAVKVGVGDFYQAGSKLPMLTALIEKTLESRRSHFQPLIIEIVRAGLVYRRKNKPVTSGEIRIINEIIVKIGFKFPELWDPIFLSSLPDDAPMAAATSTPADELAGEAAEAQRQQRHLEMKVLKDEFLNLWQDSDRRRAGLSLERLLNRLFEISELAPREPFRVVGEQIDGSFELDHEIYLIEAKWEKEPIQPKDLFIFREKVEGKSKFTRGIFVSISGYTSNASDALTRGKQPTFFIIDGYDLMMLLSGDVDLPVFLRRRQRILAEEGRVSVPYPELSKR